jgi:hypothetical protein
MEVEGNLVINECGKEEAGSGGCAYLHFSQAYFFAVVSRPKVSLE